MSTLVFKPKNVAVLRIYFTQRRIGRAPMTNSQFKRHPLGQLKRMFMAETSVDLTIRSQRDIKNVVAELISHPYVTEAHQPVIDRLRALDAEITLAGGWDAWLLSLAKEDPLAALTIRLSTAMEAMRNNAHSAMESMLNGFTTAARSLSKMLDIVPGEAPKKLVLK